MEEAALMHEAAPTEAARNGAPASAAAVPATSAAPAEARGWVGLLNELAAQLNDPDSDLVRRPWEHIGLYDGLGRALAALDSATPGGLEWLERHG